METTSFELPDGLHVITDEHAMSTITQSLKWYFPTVFLINFKFIVIYKSNGDTSFAFVVRPKQYLCWTLTSVSYDRCDTYLVTLIRHVIYTMQHSFLTEKL